MNWREELAWAAGFFDGEGYVGVKNRAERRSKAQLVVNITQVDRRVLDRFRAAVLGIGKVHGPYVDKGRPSHQPKHHYVAVDFNAGQSIIAMLWTWLSPVKRDQASVAVAAAVHAARNAFGQPRSRPTCKRGHPLSGDNAYMFTQGAKDYLSRRCRRCNREGAATRKRVRLTVAALLEA